MPSKNPKLKPNPPSGSDTNLLWAVAGLLLVSLVASGFTAYACDFVVSSFQNSNTMALLITDAGVKSDDKNFERQLSTATLTLNTLRDVGLAVVVGALMVLTAMGFRIWRSFKNG